MARAPAACLLPTRQLPSVHRMKHDRIIDLLTEAMGSQRELGEWFGLNHSTICHWKGDGIPARHWPELLRLANAYGLKLKLEDIEAHSPLRAA